MKNPVVILVLLGIVSLGLVVWRGLSHPRLPVLQNFEAQEFLAGQAYLDPASVQDGLAVYAVGSGAPVLLFPYPHAHTVEPMAQGPIANTLVEMGRTVITFDVPGAYRSTREPVGDMAEMLASAVETLDRLGIEEPVEVVGHSMSGLAALAFAIEHPQRTKQLVLIGSMSGFPAALEHGLPKSTWKMNEVAYWKFIFLGLKVKSGVGSLADHKRLHNLMSRESFYDKSLFTPLEIDPDDTQQGIPVRELVWGGNLFQKLDYAKSLDQVQAPTLILVGRHDAEAPFACSEELNRGIPNSEILIFESSGHSPFLEEPQAFMEALQHFLGRSLTEIPPGDSAAAP